MTSLIRWAGSKRQLLPVLQSLAPRTYGHYFEPFLGSGCLYFSLAPSQATLSDVNRPLIAMYLAIARHPAEVSQYLASIPHTSQAYYVLRSVDPESIEDSAAAARFIFLMKACFNGVYRTNRNGMFNTPFGGRVYRLPTLDDLTHVSHRLRSCVVRDADFAVAFEEARGNDFIYADPPYPALRHRGEYGYDCFSAPDMRRLAELAKAATTRGVRVMLSFCDSEWLTGHFTGWYRTTAVARRTVSGQLMNRKTVNELVITNYGPDE